MKASKTLTSAVVATALVSAIGLAYAQSADTTSPMSPDAAGTSGQAVQNQPSSDTSATTNADTSFQTERPAQADRN
jgi:hypothetical protein